MQRTRVPEPHERRAQPVTIVMYHSVSDVPGPYTISPASFRRQVEAIAAAFRVIRLDSVPAELETAGGPERRVVLTFDDAFVDCGETAFPILAELGLPSMLFVPTGFIGRDNAWDTGPAGLERRPIMDSHELRRWYDTGLVDMGAHTVDHVRMSAVSTAEMRRQASDSRAMLEDLLGAAVVSFAYPYGQLDDFDDASTRVLAELGYRVAVTTHWGTRNAPRDLMKLRRIWFRDTDDAATVRHKIQGWYDWIALKERAGAAIRRARRARSARGRRERP